MLCGPRTPRRSRCHGRRPVPGALELAAASKRRAQRDVRARVCLRRYLPLHHFGSREEPGPRRPAAEWLPVHTLPPLIPPTPPLLLLAFPSSFCSSSGGRSCAPKGSRETQRKAGVGGGGEKKGGEGSAGVFGAEVGAGNKALIDRGRAGP